MTTMPIAVPDHLPRALATTREPAEASARRATLRAEEIELRLAEIELDSRLHRPSVAIPFELVLAIALAVTALAVATSTIARVALAVSILAATIAAVASVRRRHSS